jgi:hypothetical protein
MSEEKAMRIKGYEELKEYPGKVCYWKVSDGSFLIHWPEGLMGNLRAHNVVEHEDGTITVTPSILTTMEHKGMQRHGYLTKGMWRDC